MDAGAEGFAQFVEARQRALQRTAWLNTGTGPVSYLGSLLFAGDDLVLCLFQGPSRAAVIAASDRLGIPCERLMDSAWLSSHRRGPEGTQQCSHACPK